MNQIAHLVNKKFEDLNGKELLDVIAFYVDTNTYPSFPIEMETVSVKEVTEYFEYHYYPIIILELFYEEWTK